jgi:hypothetical protein
LNLRLRKESGNRKTTTKGREEDTKNTKLGAMDRLPHLRQKLFTLERELAEALEAR